MKMRFLSARFRSEAIFQDDQDRWWNLMNRGDRHEPVFRDDTDHERLLATLAEACTKTDWSVHAFCVLHNHFISSSKHPGQKNSLQQ
jgi:hypothetical protein